MWITELATKTNTADTRIGSHSAESPVMTPPSSKRDLSAEMMDVLGRRAQGESAEDAAATSAAARVVPCRDAAVARIGGHPAGGHNGGRGWPGRARAAIDDLHAQPQMLAVAARGEHADVLMLARAADDAPLRAGARRAVERSVPAVGEKRQAALQHARERMIRAGVARREPAGPEPGAHLKLDAIPPAAALHPDLDDPRRHLLVAVLDREDLRPRANHGHRACARHRHGIQRHRLRARRLRPAAIGRRMQRGNLHRAEDPAARKVVVLRGGCGGTRSEDGDGAGQARSHARGSATLVPRRREKGVVPLFSGIARKKGYDPFFTRARLARGDYVLG